MEEEEVRQVVATRAVMVGQVALDMVEEVAATLEEEEEAGMAEVQAMEEEVVAHRFAIQASACSI